MASASIIRENPEDALARPVTKFDPPPQFGPKFHLERGPEVIVFPRHDAAEEEGVADMFSFAALCVSFGIALLSSVPRFQRVLLLLKLMD